MGYIARRREEAARAERDDAAETQAWIASVDRIEHLLPSDGSLTVNVVEELRTLPVRQRPSEVANEIAYWTARHFTSELAARRSRKAILASQEAKEAGDPAGQEKDMLQYRYMKQISEQLAL